MLTLLLLSLIILGMMYIMAALLDWDQDSLERIVNLYSYLPMLYSWMSFLGKTSQGILALIINHEQLATSS